MAKDQAVTSQPFSAYGEKSPSSKGYDVRNPYAYKATQIAKAYPTKADVLAKSVKAKITD